MQEASQDSDGCDADEEKYMAETKFDPKILNCTTVRNLRGQVLYNMDSCHQDPFHE